MKTKNRRTISSLLTTSTRLRQDLLEGIARREGKTQPGTEFEGVGVLAQR